jgi:probable HAF family extracellular repeat protein
LGGTDSRAWRINDAGTAVGYAAKYVVGTDLGDRAARWDASGTAATELDNLGTDGNARTGSQAYAINASGTTVGYATKYENYTSLGNRAVRWNASGTAATELGNLGTDGSGFTQNYAYAINAAGRIVGYAEKYAGGMDQGQRAVLWNPDGAAIDLNTQIDPASGWTLTEAEGISDTNWVTGLGNFDPDGAGPLESYQRAFLLNVSSVVPEPALAGLLAGALALLMLRRRN